MKELRKVFGLLPSSLRWRWYGLLPLLLLTAGLEALGAAAVFALLRVLTNPSSALDIPLVSAVPWLGEGADARLIVLSFTVGVMALYVFRLMALGVVSLVRNRLVFASIGHLSDDVLGGYLEGPFTVVSLRTTTEMLRRVDKGTNTVVSGMSAAAHVIAEVFVVAALVILLGVTAPFTTLIGIALTVVLLLLPAALSKAAFVRWGTHEDQAGADLLHQLRQGLGALREIRVYGRQAFFRERVIRALDSLSRIRLRRSVTSEVLRLSVETIFVMVLLLAVAVLAWRLQPTDVLSLLGLYAYAGFRLVPSANRITLNLNDIHTAAPVALSLFTDVDQLSRTRQPLARDSAPLALRQEIAFENVEYRYSEEADQVLSAINLTIRHGESIGVVGPSGAGKSTLADLMLGLLEPTAGRVLVDGQDLRNVRAAWQQRIGYVAQSFYLLDDTLRRNIAFGLDAREVDEVRLKKAVVAARLEEVLAGLPLGLDSVIGERGGRLSGGERQRVAIARALYSDPDVLVLDEATASLDPLTEREVTEAIAALHGTRTIFVIAHRISTVKGCDRIVMLRDGRIAAVGSFDDLMSRDADFRAMVAAVDVSQSA
ncbi:MAG: ABC transporter ATP-binding protein [Vicinamibacterales bacterium]